MATYHLHIRALRGQIKKKMAYRARTGAYEADDLLHSEIVMPAICDDYLPPFREMLWDYLEKTERRKNGLLAKEVVVSLPKEINEAEQIKLAREFCRLLCNQYSVFADLNIHRGRDPATDSVHAHIVLTNRCIEKWESGEGFTFLRKCRLLRDRREIYWLRQEWENRVNRALRENGIDAQVSCRRLRAQGIARRRRPHLSWEEILEEKRSGRPCARRQEFCESLLAELEASGVKVTAAVLDQLQIRESLTRSYLEKRLQEKQGEKHADLQSNRPVAVAAQRRRESRDYSR